MLFIYENAKKFGFVDLIIKSSERLAQIDIKNRKKWLKVAIKYKLSSHRYKNLSKDVIHLSEFIEKTKDYSEKKRLMKYTIKTLLSINDFNSVYFLLKKYRHYFIKDKDMVKYMIKVSLMIDKPDLAAQISKEFLEGSR